MLATIQLILVFGTREGLPHYYIHHIFTLIGNNIKFAMCLGLYCPVNVIKNNMRQCLLYSDKLLHVYIYPSLPMYTKTLGTKTFELTLL